MKVRMLTTKECYPDGIHRLECLQGGQYDLPEEAALSWIRQGWAEEDKALEAPPETKAPKPRTKTKKRKR